MLTPMLGQHMAPVRPGHGFDTAALARYLSAHLPGLDAPLTVRQFAGGQSNPTFLVESASGARIVLRKKPPGGLLPSAHAIDREFRVMRALAAHGLPIATPRLFCEDASLTGTVFYVMDFVEGRIFRDLTLPGQTPSERTAIYQAMAAALARLHTLEPAAAGLADYGRPGNYFERQITRWSRQYLASTDEPLPAMRHLMEHLPPRIPASETTAIVHGDYRLENLVFHPTEPRIAAILDWELSTLGHPLADLAYNCMPYHLDHGEYSGVRGLDLEALGIPAEHDYLAAYCRLTGGGALADWPFYVAFALFRMAAIAQGVYARGLGGNASSESAAGFAGTAGILSARACELLDGGA